MKKRVLSFLLSFGMICSNIPQGLVVTAKDDETMPTQTQQEDVHSEESVSSVEEASATEDEETVSLKIVFEDFFPDSIYYGQEKPYLSELAEDSTYLPKYYHLQSSADDTEEIPESVYNALEEHHFKLNYVRVEGEENPPEDCEESPENDTLYKIQMESDWNPEEPLEVDGVSYWMDTEFEQEFTVKKYVPEKDVSVSVTTEDDGSVFLKPTDDRFQISQSTDPQSFQNEVKAEIVDENGNYLYYLKNNVEDTEEYGAITASNSVEVVENDFWIEETAALEGNGLDIRKGFFNQSVSVAVTGYANADNATLRLFNGEELVEEVTETSFGITGEFGEPMNVFFHKFSIDLPEHSAIPLKLSAEIEVDGKTSARQSLKLEGFRNGEFLLENIEPEIHVSGDDGEWTDSLQFDVNDANSGIETVLVRINGQEFTPTKSADPNHYRFDFSEENGTVDIEIEAIDKAGNQNTFHGKKKVDGEAPEIESYEFQYQNEDGEWVEAGTDVLHAYRYGYFSQVPIRIVVCATDNHSVKSVQLYDGDNALSVSCQNVEEQENDYYFDLNHCHYENLKIYASDGAHSKFESIGRFAVEKESPNGKIENPAFNNTIDEDEINWYGLSVKNQNISIPVSDSDSGIAKVVIKDGEKILQQGDFTKGTDFVAEKTYQIPIGDFAEGVHVLSVIITDNSGNINEMNPLSFSTDFTPPSGTIALTSIPKKIDGKNWFDRDDEIGFSFTIQDKNSYKVAWNVTGKTSTNGKKLFGEKNTVSLTSTESGAALDENQEHKYTVNAIFYDKAGNTSAMDSDGNQIENTAKPVEVFKDFEKPTINQVSVTKTETGFDRVLRILSFGIYSNDKIRVTVQASDAPNDSGLAEDAVWMAIKEDAEYPDDYVKMNFNSEKNEYDFEIPAAGSVYSDFTETAMEGMISLRVTDRFGHSSNTFTKIHGGDGTTGEAEIASENFMNFMIEQIKPIVEVQKPISDGETRTDDTTWYRFDKEITIQVQDKDSGIHQVSVTVNGNPLDRDCNNLSFLTESVTMSQSKPDTTLHVYQLRTDELITFLSNTGHAPQDGHYVIRVEVEDNAGNQNAAETDYYIDKKPPHVDSIDFSIPSADNYTSAFEFIDVLEYGFYFKTDLVATANVTDEEPSSGLHRIEYKMVSYNNGVKGNETTGTARINASGQASFNIPKDFKGQIYVKGFDYVGNESEEETPQSFVIDTPERHESEEHIEIIGLDGSGYTDEEGHSLYDSNVNFTVRISDTMSGIRDISYAVSSEKDTQDIRTITIDNTGNTVGQDLGDGWTITAMDENLVTEVVCNYQLSADDNNIQYAFDMTDRSNNTSDKMTDIFSIDQTAPIINVEFDSPAGNDAYYRENRTATITVIERNFDAARILASITNEIGTVPGLSFTSVSNTEHVATIVFGEGDYTFGIDGTDRCDHVATVNYSGGNERSFHVDMTDPTETDNFDQFLNDLENSFKVDKEMVITITEHNFVPSLVNLRIYRTKAGQELAADNREDCTSELISENSWVNNGDEHTIRFRFTKDYVYQVAIRATDASGRTMEEKTSPVFEIDKTAPALKSPENLDVLVFTSKNKEKSATPIQFVDSNLAKIHYSVVSYRMKQNEDHVGYDMNVASEEFDVKSDSVVMNDKFFSQDGIYEVKCIAYDVAGNASEESTHTFVIQRDTDFLVYIPHSNKKNHTGLYKFDKTGIRSADFDDIEIVTYITKDKNFEVQIDGTEVTGEDLDVKKDSKKINQIDMYDVTLKSSYISQNYNADTIDTDLTLNAVATSKNSEQVITLGHIYIDNVKPVGEYESAVQKVNEEFFGGFYGIEHRMVTIEGVSPDIDLNQCEIQTNDYVLKYEDGGFDYDADAHTISFMIEKGYTDVRSTLVDNAGNINNLPILKKIYVGGLFARWWYLFIGGGIIVLLIPTLIITAIVRRKKQFH